jgi:predicted  nucleic acid-binding Zn ribbon protein
VSAGVIDHYRKATFCDADIIAMGHTHTCYQREISMLRLNKRNGKILNEIQTHLRIPSYKDAYSDGFGSWEASKAGHPPKTKGAWWLRFYYESKAEKIRYNCIRAN